MTSGKRKASHHVAKGTSIRIILPGAAGLKMENIRPSAVRFSASDRSEIARKNIAEGQALEVLEERGLIHGLTIEPDKTIEAGIVFDSGPNPVPGTSTRVTILTRYGNLLLGGSTYILRIPASPRKQSR